MTIKYEARYGAKNEETDEYATAPDTIINGTASSIVYKDGGVYILEELFTLKVQYDTLYRRDTVGDSYFERIGEAVEVRFF